ncbi:hypothetical protein KKP06_24670 [Ralstonia pickettii]|uniref:hypothetical protein n=1 Tax=Ralstonia pickettii TaxID=329 RepID=UPI001BE46E41|nr:hypothetical protein [Ralstonia pickettii]MBT2180999.1 hypothetical protein [Ralstonia pickettii]
MMSDAVDFPQDQRLFNTADGLSRMLGRIEQYRCRATADVLRERLLVQERAIPALGKFGDQIDVNAYAAARDRVVRVCAGHENSDALHLALLELEHTFITAKAAAGRSRSAMRFDGFWAEFDDIVRRHACRKAEDAFAQTVRLVPAPHPTLGTAQRRYRGLVNGTS